MKTCRYCAEEIQDAAILCRFCGRDQNARPAIREAKSGGGGSAIAALSVAVSVVAIFGVLAYGAMSAKAAPTPPTTDSAAAVPDAPPPPPPPTIVGVADTAGLEVEAGRSLWYTFTVNDPRPCTLTGRVVGLHGGNRDIDVMLLDDDGLINWRNGARAQPVLSEEHTSAMTLHHLLPRTGTYHLVLSNAFSVLTDKTVQLQNVKVTCSSDSYTSASSTDGFTSTTDTAARGS